MLQGVSHGNARHLIDHHRGGGQIAGRTEHQRQLNRRIGAIPRIPSGRHEIDNGACSRVCEGNRKVAVGVARRGTQRDQGCSDPIARLKERYGRSRNGSRSAHHRAGERRCCCNGIAADGRRSTSPTDRSISGGCPGTTAIASPSTASEDRRYHDHRPKVVSPWFHHFLPDVIHRIVSIGQPGNCSGMTQ